MPRFHFRSRLARLVRHDAITIGQHCYVAGDVVSGQLAAHETWHAWRFRQTGVVWGVLRYLALGVRYGYANHPEVLDAYAFGRVNGYRFPTLRAPS
ncbi:MAG TPA: hypothetical protein VFN76_10050 [Candidatus Limnocylindria bacterium]|nr:hypothetical protein [Candidatus Limnocylindria bacterium]